MRIKPKSPREALQPEPAPAPPQRSRHVRNPFVILINMVITLTVFGLAAFGGALYFGKQKFEEKGPLQKEATVVISSALVFPASPTGCQGRASSVTICSTSGSSIWASVSTRTPPN